MDAENKADISDGHHTFEELYAHRRELFFALCRSLAGTHTVWRSKQHNEEDAPIDDEVFIMGIGTEAGKQISYHIKRSHWDDAGFAQTLLQAPKWDGHTPEDVLVRLQTLR